MTVLGVSVEDRLVGTGMGPIAGAAFDFAAVHGRAGLRRGGHPGSTAGAAFNVCFAAGSVGSHRHHEFMSLFNRRKPEGPTIPERFSPMALRSPTYLDTETLLSLAEYFDLDVPHQSDVVEKTVRKRSGGGKIGASSVGVEASAGRDVEYQASYSLEPKVKATVNKVIDALIRAGAVDIGPGDQDALTKDGVVELEGCARITTASVAGKVFYIFRRLMGDVEGQDLDSIFKLDDEELPPGTVEQLQSVYLQNELLPIPVLLELTGSGLSSHVYVNLRPDHFVEAADANRIEGDMRVLGTVSRIVPGGDDGYFSAEEWLLHDWEYLMRRMLMTQIKDVVDDLVDKFDLDMPADDVRAHIAGPAIVIDAIALY